MEIRTRQVVEWRVEALWDHGFEFAADQGLAIMISHAPDPAAAAPTAAGCSGAGSSPAEQPFQTEEPFLEELVAEIRHGQRGGHT